MNDSREQLSNLSAEQRALLLLRLKKQKEQDAKKEEKAIVRQSRSSCEFPLSFAQQGIWFLEQLEKDSVEYNFALAFSLKGRLNVAAFEKSINDIARRHEILRTTFKRVDGQPIQDISPARTIPLNIFDLAHLPKDEQAEKIKKLADEEAALPFDLIEGPLLRVSLLQLEDEDHVFFLSIHHIVFDGWSRAVFNSELSALYEANVNGTAAELPDLPIQYADYSFWQNQLLIKDQLAGQLDYWKNRLAGAPPVVSFPTDKVRARSQKAVASAETFSIDPDLGNKLKQLCRQTNTTMFMSVFAVFSLLLSRYSGSQDVVIGLPMVDRSHRETEDLIGLFLNTIALRIDLTAQPSFHQLLHQVKQVSREALDNQDIPFQKLVEELHPERNLLYSPIFQVMFNLQSDPKEGIELTGLEVTPLKFRNSLPGTNYDLMFSFTDGEDGVRGVAEYNTDLYDPTTISRMIRNLQILLQGCVDNPEASVNAIPILSDEEEHQILTLWNQTGTDYPLDATLQQLFETQVDITPEATALEFGEQALSYFELDERANRVAHYLRENGIGPGKLVGVYMERSLEMVVTLCGILKSGGAYVPMDPEYPTDRIAFMVDETQVPVLLTQEHLRNRLPPTNSKVVCVDTDWEVIASNSGSRIADTSTAADLAYVIYTSGSTGKPKGVMNCHSGIVNHLFWMKENYPLQEDDRILQKTPYSFDVSVWEIFWPLVSGARLVMAQPGGHKDPMYLAKVIEDKRITTMHFVASMLKSYLEHAPLSAARSLKRVITSGEALSYELQEQFFKASSAQLVNLYGPTEAAVHVTRWECQHGDSRLAMPIGRPIANTRMYILDPHMQPVPVGVPGELHIGGIQVAQGYLNRPDLTAEKFIADPFSDDAKARLYKTGDQARYRADGNIEYIGRIDYQVKLRGFRIELGEIESVLADHEAVQDAVAVMREDEPGDKKLVAYMVAEAGDPVAPSVKDLRSFLRAKLPDFMMPAALVLLDRLPLSANGKLDRKALPRPEADDQVTSVYVAPRTPTEEVLAEIWAQVLGVERVGIHDDFFELGGHSLLAIRLIEQMRRAGLGVEVRTLFGAPTIEALAAVAGGDDTVAVPPNGIPAGCEAITPGMLPLVALTAEQIERVVASVPGGASNVQDIYPLAPLQEGILFHHLMAGEGDPYLLRWLKGFDSRSRLDAYIEALGAVIDRHDILRTAVVWEGLTEPVQVVWREAALVVEEVSLDAGAGDVAAQLWARIDPRAYRLDVSEAPLLRVFVAEDAAKGRWVMLQLAHHLAIDHTTVDVMQEEIQAHLLGEADQLPAPLPFRNFVAQARLGVSREEHEVFFSELLGDVEEPTAPFGLVDVQGDGSGITKANHPIEASLAKRLWARARALGVSAASLCHLAYAQVLARTSGRDDVVFGTVLFGRMQGGVGAEALGMFINTLPVRIRLGDATVEASVRETHTQLAQLLHHEHASLALAQRASAVMAPMPLFSALMNYRHIAGAGEPSAEARRAWEGVESLGVEERTNYPLVLSVNDLGGESLSLTAQARQPLDPERICAYMDTALESLVEALERTPVAPVHSLEVLGAGEREQLLSGWNATAVEYPRGESLKGLFEAQVEREPEVIALEYEDQSLTYREFNKRANQLAHYLREQGVEPDSIVGICLERGFEAVITVLAVLKAGGGYTPLDPSYPEERLGFMLQTSQAVVLVTKTDLARKFPTSEALHICLDEDTPWSDYPAHNPDHDTRADHTAYVIFTSGSTGRPKGIIMPHGVLCNLVQWQLQRWGQQAISRTLQFSAFSFDVSFQEMLSTLVAGGTLVLVDEALRRDPERLLDFLHETRIGRVFMPFAGLNQLAEVSLSSRRVPGHLREIITAGEALQVTPALEYLFEQLGECTLDNQYGPSETHVVTAHRLAGNAREWPRLPAIGRPIANAKIFILDEHLRPVPVGVPGEMYIGGDCMAQGYIGQPALTEERFIRSPFSDAADARLYRTGDMARYVADGSIEFLGRVDSQVKVRGYRIELGEIEAVIMEHAGVKACVAMVREDGEGNQRLVAYVIMQQGAASGPDVLRQHARGILPEFMVPSAFVFLEALPMTPSGKVDRKALPEPGDVRASLGTEYTAPRNELEQQLAEIWAEVLKLERVGVHDNFFDLGGHSLMATQVASRIRDQLNIDLPLSEIFDCPMLDELARKIELIKWTNQELQGDEADEMEIFRI